MPVEMAIPFALGPNGSVALVTDPYSRVTQRVKAIVGSRPTERVMDADFGVPLDRLLFDEDDESTEAEMRQLIEKSLRIYEPGVEVFEVTPEMDQAGDGIASVKVDFRLTEDPTTAGAQFVNTAVVLAGGTVKETLRG